MTWSRNEYPGHRFDEGTGRASVDQNRHAPKRAGNAPPNGLPAHSFQSLLGDLATLTRNRVRPAVPGAMTVDILTRSHTTPGQSLPSPGRHRRRTSG